MDQNYRREILSAALEARMREVTEYQVNIDNFRLAIDIIGQDESLQAFAQELGDLMRSSIFEQKKAKIMLEVIKSQME